MSREFTVAGGRFAPGHLGELTQILPFDLVDAVLDETLSVQRRLRDLPSRVGVYFVLAMCLFPEVGYRLVWQKLSAALTGAGLETARPAAKALRDLRRRVGAAPMRHLFDVVAGPLARPTTRGVRFGSLRSSSPNSSPGTRSPRCEPVLHPARWYGGAAWPEQFGPAGVRGVAPAGSVSAGWDHRLGWLRGQGVGCGGGVGPGRAAGVRPDSRGAGAPDVRRVRSRGGGERARRG
ncbi:transposase domain-containing protein [Streptomyces sp. NPDC086838]|uniref:transposase domain-containing protein n=1 Tax=Streptomyces sp. NPDC086838 TaxID=3365762 RepID=UPI003822A2C3